MCHPSKSAFLHYWIKQVCCWEWTEDIFFIFYFLLLAILMERGHKYLSALYMTSQPVLNSSQGADGAGAKWSYIAVRGCQHFNNRAFLPFSHTDRNADTFFVCFCLLFFPPPNTPPSFFSPFLGWFTNNSEIQRDQNVPFLFPPPSVNNNLLSSFPSMPFPLFSLFLSPLPISLSSDL